MRLTNQHVTILIFIACRKSQPNCPTNIFSRLNRVEQSVIRSTSGNAPYSLHGGGSPSPLLKKKIYDHLSRTILLNKLVIMSELDSAIGFFFMDTTNHLYGVQLETMASSSSEMCFPSFVITIYGFFNKRGQ